MKNSIEANFPEHSIPGMELTSFVLQPGFVEGVVIDELPFRDIVQAYQHIFRNNKEYAIALWNGIPIKMSYQEDIPSLIPQLVSFLKNLKNGASVVTLQINSSNLEVNFTAQCTTKTLTLSGDFKRVTGNYQNVLQGLHMIKMDLALFLNEWKLLIEQLIAAMEQSRTNLISIKTRQTLYDLQALNNSIAHRGILYR